MFAKWANFCRDVLSRKMKQPDSELPTSLAFVVAQRWCPPLRHHDVILPL